MFPSHLIIKTQPCKILMDKLIACFIFFFFLRPDFQSCNMQLKLLNRRISDNIGDPEFGCFTNEAIRRMPEQRNKDLGLKHVNI